MGRRKEYCKTFTDVFGNFCPSPSDLSVRPAIVKTVTGENVHRCNNCGHNLRIHDVGFRDVDSHSAHYYGDCECCGATDGEWYESEEEATTAWNKLNPDSNAVVDENLGKRKEFIEDILKYSHILA